MSRPRWIHASHNEAEMARHLAEAQQSSILAREQARDARRAAEQAAMQPPPPPQPKPKPPRPKPVQTPRRAESPPPVPPGHVLVEADVLDALIATSSLTKGTR